MKVKIKKWDAVATWRWDLPEDDVCGICQVHFDGTCPTCKYPGDDCSLCTFALFSPTTSFLAQLTNRPCSVWEVWSQLPHGQCLARLALPPPRRSHELETDGGKALYNGMDQARLGQGAMSHV